MNVPMEVFCRMTTVRRADLSCVVQAGGLSTRMGCDKARMVFCGEPLIERVLGRLATVAGELVVTTSRPSELAYLEERTFGGLVPRIVSDLEGPAGAMRGIASSLTAARLPLVAIVACDMPFVSSELIGALAGCVEAEALDVCVPREERGIEPLCAVWRRDACAPVAQELLAFHHIEGANERNDDLAFVIRGIAKRGLAVCIAIRRGGRFLFRSMSTATATAGTGLGTIASARLSRVGANIVRHDNSNRLGEQLGRRKLLGRIDVLEAERRACGRDNLRLVHITSLNAIDQAANALAIAGEQLPGDRCTRVTAPDSAKRLNPPLLARHAHVERLGLNTIGKRADEFRRDKRHVAGDDGHER